MSWDVLGKANTNLIKYSEDFSQWSNTAPLTTESSDRFGGITLTTITDNLTTAARSRLLAPSSFFETPALDAELCFSLFVEKDNVSSLIRFASIRIVWTTGTRSARVNFDTSTGDTFGIAGVNVNILGYGVEDCGDFWRFYVSGSHQTNDTLAYVVIVPAANNGTLETNISDNAVTGSIKCFGAMLNYGRMPLPYRKTAGTEISWSGQSDDSQSWSTQSKKSTTWVTA